MKKLLLFSTLFCLASLKATEPKTLWERINQKSYEDFQAQQRILLTLSKITFAPGMPKCNASKTQSCNPTQQDDCCN